MCGRFTLRTPANVLITQFGLPDFAASMPPVAPRYNIAPTQSVLAVRENDEGQHDPVMLHWGLIPFWAKDRKIGNRMINARAETVADKPAFRKAFRARRCLILADGYYEWQKTGGRTKQPYYFHRRDNRPFAFAGLWESWTDKTQSDDEEKSVVESCTIITTEPNDLAREIHDRMPVLLSAEDHALWLDRQVDDPKRLSALLRPAAEDFLDAYPISTLVNKPTNEGAMCIDPL